MRVPALLPLRFAARDFTANFNGAENARSREAVAPPAPPRPRRRRQVVRVSVGGASRWSEGEEGAG